jgi:hypothetical protein
MKKSIAFFSIALLIVSLSCKGNGGTVTGNDAAVAHFITFEKNDPDAVGRMESQRITSGSSTALTGNAFTKGSWAFMGWALSADGESTYADGASYAMGDADVTLYAQWSRRFTAHYLAQTDAAWMNDALGSSSSDTIGSAGNTMTAAAMLLSAEIPTITPKSLNEWLRDNGKYVSGDIFNWHSIDDYPGNAYRWSSSDTFSLGKLKAELDMGNPVIMGYQTVMRYGIVLDYVRDGTAYSDFHYYRTADASAIEHALDVTDNPARLICYHK